LLHEELASKLSGRVTVVGVGDVRRGDDCAGPLVIQLLAEAGIERVIDSGASPELDTWKLREMAPDTVLFVDAVDFGGAPGDAALLSPSDLRASGFDTHRAPLRLTMDYLERELQCKCFVLAIQPKDVRHGAPMCVEVKRSAEYLAGVLRSIIAQTSERA